METNILKEGGLTADRNGTLNPPAPQYEFPEAADPANGRLQAEVSERCRVEAALRASELSYRRLFEAAKDGILILDVATGRIKDVNPFLVELLGFSHAEMSGKTVGELSPFKDVVSNEVMLEKPHTDDELLAAVKSLLGTDDGTQARNTRR